MSIWIWSLKEEEEEGRKQAEEIPVAYYFWWWCLSVHTDQMREREKDHDRTWRNNEVWSEVITTIKEEKESKKSSKRRRMLREKVKWKMVSNVGFKDWFDLKNNSNPKEKERKRNCKPTAIVRYWEGASFQINWHPIFLDLVFINKIQHWFDQNGRILIDQTDKQARKYTRFHPWEQNISNKIINFGIEIAIEMMMVEEKSES